MIKKEEKNSSEFLPKGWLTKRLMFGFRGNRYCCLIDDQLYVFFCFFS